MGEGILMSLFMIYIAILHIRLVHYHLYLITTNFVSPQTFTKACGQPGVHWLLIYSEWSFTACFQTNKDVLKWQIKELRWQSLIIGYT